MLTYRHFNNTLFSYLSARLTAYTPSRSLRSCSAQLLSALRINLKSAGERSFRFHAPRVWNSLPVEIRQSPSLSSFKNVQLHVHLRIDSPIRMTTCLSVHTFICVKTYKYTGVQ